MTIVPMGDCTAANLNVENFTMPTYTHKANIINNDNDGDDADGDIGGFDGFESYESSELFIGENGLDPSLAPALQMINLSNVQIQTEEEG